MWPTRVSCGRLWGLTWRRRVLPDARRRPSRSAIAWRGHTGAVPLAEMQIETESIDPNYTGLLYRRPVYRLHWGATRGSIRHGRRTVDGIPISALSRCRSAKSERRSMTFRTRTKPSCDATTFGVDRQDGAFSWRFVSPLYVAATLNPINSSLIATALVPIAHALGVSVGQTAILVSALYLASSIAQPAAGKLAEEFGPRRVLLAGIVLVLLGGAIGGVAQAIPAMAAARALIGIGTSAGYPAAMVIIRRRAISAGLSEPPGGVLGGLAIAASVTVAIGPPIGGVLVDAFGWRSTFLFNIPMTVIALPLTIAWIPKDEPLQRRPLLEIASRIDVTGIALFGGMMSALLVFLMSLPRPHWIALGVSIALSVALLLWELRASAPFIDMRLLTSNPALTRTYIRGALFLLSFYA